MAIDDGIIPHSQVQQSSPTPNPVINTLVNTADRKSATNPTGQLDRMYAFAYLMNNTAFSTRSNVPTFYLAQTSALLRKMFQQGSFDSWLQVLSFTLDPKFFGFTGDPTMKPRMALVASSKIVTILPEVRDQIVKFLTALPELELSTGAVVAKVRDGAKDEPLVRTALAFQQPSMYTCAQETMILYHSLYLLCLSLHGLEAQMIPLPTTDGQIQRTKLREITLVLTDLFFQMAPHVSLLWNYAMSAVYDWDIPQPTQIATQNLNMVSTMFELAPLETFQEYSAFLMLQFKRITDRKTPNWLSPAFAQKPVSVDAVDHTAESTRKAILDLKTLIYSREV